MRMRRFLWLLSFAREKTNLSEREIVNQVLMYCRMKAKYPEDHYERWVKRRGELRRSRRYYAGLTEKGLCQLCRVPLKDTKHQLCPACRRELREYGRKHRRKGGATR